MNLEQDRIQQEAFAKWLDSKCIGSLNLSTATGKTRIGVMAVEKIVKEVKNFKALVITPTETIRDKEWKENFKKWSSLKTYNKYVTTCCIQTCYKWKDTHWDLIILDECHRYLVREGVEDYKFFKFFENNTWDKILGLSGSIANNLKASLNKIAPIVYTFNTNEAVKAKIVSPFKIYNLKVELTKSEEITYKDLTRRIEWATKNHIKAWKLIGQRTQLLYNAENKFKAIKELSDYLKGSGIIFSQRTEFADKVTEMLNSCVSYHSKLSKKEREKNLNDFIKGKINRISAAKALDEGLNIPNLNFAITAAGNSKEREQVQRLGRCIRRIPNKIAILVRLYIKNTRDENWLISSQAKFKVKYINEIKQIKS